MTKTVCVPVSVGELLDKLTILNIKRVMINDVDKISILKKELIELMDMSGPSFSDPEIEKLYDLLMIVNKNLWDVEDELRKMELDKNFNEEFILKARSVYFLNDRRYELKSKINTLCGSEIREVKQYIDYK